MPKHHRPPPVVPIHSTMRGPTMLAWCDRGSDRQQPHASLESAVALDELEVLGDDEDEAEQGQEASRDG